jgi:hypothetical protein
VHVHTCDMCVRTGPELHLDFLGLSEISFQREKRNLLRDALADLLSQDPVLQVLLLAPTFDGYLHLYIVCVCVCLCVCV